eukprot:TRINITY_DN753_c0_g1_i1.p1 TRINITY_DN753_c0_g1~~TRINITY_DN753_c0_g1_i1.p1  ORF type:complete len:262 (+),score=50.19 TRINITY_DN753_c0_g1_i1:63-848(+)
MELPLGNGDDLGNKEVISFQNIVLYEINRLSIYTKKTMGRDRLLRLLDYSVRWILYINPTDYPRIKYLNQHLLLSRKLFRFGRTIEFINNILVTIFGEKSKSLSIFKRLLLIGKFIGYGGWLFFDSAVWLDKVFELKKKRNWDTKKIGDLSAKFWIFGIICGLIVELYTLITLVIKKKKESNTLSNDSIDISKKYSITAPSTTFKTILSIIKSLCDLSIPTFKLKYASPSIVPNQGFVSFYTIISTFIALYLEYPVISRKL